MEVLEMCGIRNKMKPVVFVHLGLLPLDREKQIVLGAEIRFFAVWLERHDFLVLFSLYPERRDFLVLLILHIILHIPFSSFRVNLRDIVSLFITFLHLSFFQVC